MRFIDVPDSVNADMFVGIETEFMALPRIGKIVL
jgi:hypothetical protein